ncbi:glycosyltransferase family 2 protein [bacterium]|nr:glycosyltransferase family 2 protein [bacterium]
MPEAPLVSIVICSLDGERFVEQTLASLAASTYPYKEIILVDNGSGPAMKALMERLPENIIKITLPRNLGFAAGNNRGIAASHGEFVILLNDDTEVEPDWIDAIIERFASDPRICVVGCKILDMDKKTLQHAGGFVSENGICTHRGHGEPDRGQFDEPLDVGYVTGAAFAVRRSIFKLVGLLEESYFPLYFEETEFCHAVQQVGGRVVYEPRAVVYHHGMRTSRPFSARYFYRFHRNRLRFVLRNRPRGEWLRLLVMELRWIAGARQVRQYGPLALAYLSTVLELPAILRGRRRHLRRLLAHRGRLLPRP